MAVGEQHVAAAVVAGRPVVAGERRVAEGRAVELRLVAVRGGGRGAGGRRHVVDHEGLRRVRQRGESLTTDHADQPVGPDVGGGEVAGPLVLAGQAVHQLRVLGIGVGRDGPRQDADRRGRAVRSGEAGDREVLPDQPLVVVLGILRPRQPELLDVARAARLPRLFASFREHGEQDGREDRDDRDHDQQLDEGESTSTGHSVCLLAVPPVHGAGRRRGQPGSDGLPRHRSPSPRAPVLILPTTVSGETRILPGSCDVAQSLHG